MFLSGGCISLLLCVLKDSLASAAVPPPAISLSGSSLAAALLLPDNSTLTSNLNVTQQEQKLLQLFNSNQTSDLSSVRESSLKQTLGYLFVLITA